MTSTMPCVLAINGGSSRIKFALFAFGDNLQKIWIRICDGLGFIGLDLNQ